MTWKAIVRASAAAEKRQQREAHRRLRDLERRSKERAKLSTLEQARLDVETHQGELDVRLSIHKEQSERWDWRAIATLLPPLAPQKQRHQELRAQQSQILAAAGFPSFVDLGRARTMLAEAREYRETQALNKMSPEERARYLES